MRLPAPKGHRRPLHVDDELYWSLLGPFPPVDRGMATFQDWDGCTASPDCPLGYDIRPACFLHDYVVHLKDHSRNAIGFRFYRNVYRCVRYYGAPWVVAIGLAFLYSTVVYPAFKFREWVKRKLGRAKP